ncbi:MAG: homocysteine S-methyltransferase family protein [Clostridia bacterium]|nr:homocysteine S-methyltransferase family protein [Clostridia bacterium]
MGAFSEAISNQVLLFDGSMGALIGQMGIKTACPDELAVTSPEVISGIHKKYLEAGANVILSDTFGATEMALSHKGKKGQSASITKAAVTLAKEAAGENALVAVDIGPTSEFLYPVGQYKMEDFFETFLIQLRAAKEAGADFAMIETQTDVSEARAAALAAKEIGLECAVSFTFQNGKTLTGACPEVCAKIAEAAGAVAVGINCSEGPEQMMKTIGRLINATHLPVIVQPNAGLPKSRPDGSTYYPYTPEEMHKAMKTIVEMGAGAIGGCCGTTPEHIKAISALAGGEPKKRDKDEEKYVSSARAFYPLSEAHENQAEVSDPEDMFDLEPEDLLAVIDLDEIDADEISDFVSECAANGKTPLAFKTDDTEKLEKALFTYPGIACVFSGAQAKAVCEKYGSMLIEA